MKSRPVIIIFILALVSTVLVHIINHSYLLDINAANLRQGVSVITQDDPSYLVPVENYLAGNGWRSNAVGNAAFVTRTPGYGILYAAFRCWLPQKAALICLLSFQFLLFALSASAVYGIMRRFGKNVHLSFWTAMAYATVPIFSGFLSYTLTEGVTPSLVIFFIYFVLAGMQGSKKYYLFSALILAMLIIIRPPMVVLLIVYPLQMLGGSWKSNWKRASQALTIALTPLLIWQVYGLSKTNEYPGLHAIYHDDANDLYRPVHQSLWDFHKSWGQEGAEFHNDVNGMWQAALNGESPHEPVEQIMTHLPDAVIESVGEQNLLKLYQTYYEVLKSQKPYFESHKAMDGQTPLELIMVDSLRKYTNDYRSANWINTWIVAPSQVYWELAAHSNLSLYVFQKPWRGNLLMEAFRVVSFLIHLGIFILFPILLIWKFRNKTVLVFGLPIAIYLIYLCFVQRGVEERYTLPFLLPMLIFVVVLTTEIFKQIRSNNG